MDLNTGRLFPSLFAAAREPGADAVVVPSMYQRLATRKLSATSNGHAAPAVNLRSSHPLAKWARDQRKEKRKAKIAAASRRRNRNVRR